MSEYIHTIEVATANSNTNMNKNFAEALATALNWELISATNYYSVKKPNSNMCFRFSNSTNTLYVRACRMVEANENLGNSITYSNTAKYYLDYIIGEQNTVTVGIRKREDTLKLSCCIAQNLKDEDIAMTLSANTITTKREIYDTAKTMNLTTTSTDGVSTAIVILPDIWGASSFKDLYLLISCPFTSTDNLILLNESYYRYIGTDGTKGGLFIKLPSE